MVFPARLVRGCRSPSPPSRPIPPARPPSIDGRRGPPGLRSPTEHVTSRPGRSKSTILPWDSPAPSGHVTGGARQPPLHRHPRERPLPHDVPTVLRSTRDHLVDHVPSSWFCTTSTAFSARGSRACCIPLPILGFIAFHAPRPVSTGKPLAPGPHARSPRCGSHPPEDVFSPIRRTTSPRSSRIGELVAA